MNIIQLPTLPLAYRLSNTSKAPAAQVSPRTYRERDFGVGYGRSSGYAAERQYVSGWNGQPRFRCG
ncbi:MAG: hypothetical protein JWL98_1432 [Xanthomonadaceae bacterium]|nr:hypothetical protein [Xanthomonadaceae bacterium]